jgi:drug/metabolite transporter (DMT)-like permease
VAIKLCLTGIGSFTAAGIRFSIAAAVIFLWARIKKTPLKLNQKQLGQMVILSAIFIVQLSCFYLGLSKTTASHGVLISNMLPFIILVMAHFFIPGDNISLKKGIGITLGFMGVLFLFFDDQDLAGNLKKGDLIILIAGELYKMYFISDKTIAIASTFIKIIRRMMCYFRRRNILISRKNISFAGRNILTIGGYYLMVIFSLHFSHIISNPWETICGCLFDKLFIGIVTGGIAFYNGAVWYEFLKEKNGNKAYFPFQKVAMPIIPIILLSLLFSFLT